MRLQKTSPGLKPEKNSAKEGAQVGPLSRKRGTRLGIELLGAEQGH